MKNNGKNNAKQRERRRLPGGITGRGFMPGESGNPKGRPRTRGLINALRAKVAAVRDDGRTVEELLATELVHQALYGRNRLPAIQAIFDRLEGKPKQQVDFNGITRAMQGRSIEELEFYAVHGHWPDNDNRGEEDSNGQH